jgi:hypothetical protein
MTFDPRGLVLAMQLRPLPQSLGEGDGGEGRL